MAVTPIDGRYRARTRALEAYFSEFALIRYRVRVEVEWYLSLAADPAIDTLKPISPATAKKLRAIYEDFALDDARSRRLRPYRPLTCGSLSITRRRPRNLSISASIPLIR